MRERRSSRWCSMRICTSSMLSLVIAIMVWGGSRAFAAPSMQG
jgi:hypothetical protein